MDGLLLRSAEELLARHAAPAAVRAIRAGGSPEALWAALDAAGFPDALVPEAAGGVGLSPAEVLPVLMAAGGAALPLPLGETMLARAALAAAGEAVLHGPVVLGEAAADGARLPGLGGAHWLLVPEGDGAHLLPSAALSAEEATPYGLTVRWAPGEGRHVAVPDLAAAGAWAEAAAMAGAMEAVLAATVRHARDRQQFGRPVAAFQAVQQQISVMTEDVFAARMAAQLASVADGTGVAGLRTARVAAAKIRVGEAAGRVAAIAHAVHGAMGITEELDLHLLTARLQAGRLRFGGEGYWAGWLGRQALADGGADMLSFVRARLGPGAAEPHPTETPA